MTSIILGAGMAGASLAAELAPLRRVLLLKVEDQPGRHATGRSAAMFFESYGNATVRALTRASRALRWFRGRTATALACCPILRSTWVAGAVLDESGHDMDVAAIHQGYLRSARRAGSRIVLGAAEVTLARSGGIWHVRSRVGAFEAPVVVNATGAWADAVARQAGARPVGLQPMRRTAVTLPPPPGHDIRNWPMVIDVGEEFYFKPDAGQLLLSPANEDPMDPCDAVPEVRRLKHRWAGLRSFVADRSPVVGFDDRAEGFFWLAGQGGYGIQMAPALARAAAALVTGQALPEDVSVQGVTEEALSPSRSANQ